MRRTVLVVALAVVAGCGGGEEARPNIAVERGPTAKPLPLAPAPAAAARACRVSRLLRPICPRRVPAARYRSDDVGLAPVGGAGGRFDVFELVGRRGRAPHVVHLVVVAGRYGLGRSARGVFADWPRPPRSEGVRDGLFRKRSRRPLLLARPTWHRLEGELVLDRTRPAHAGGHLVFRWQARGVDYAVSLHAWEPLREAVATLRAVVSTTRAAGPKRP